MNISEQKWNPVMQDLMGKDLSSEQARAEFAAAVGQYAAAKPHIYFSQNHMFMWFFLLLQVLECNQNSSPEEKRRYAL